MSARLGVHRLTSWRHLQPRTLRNVSRTYVDSCRFPLELPQHVNRQNLVVLRINDKLTPAAKCSCILTSSHTQWRLWTLNKRVFSSDSTSSSAGGDGKRDSSPKNEETTEPKHRDAEKDPLPEWPGGVNPHTGERGGPKGPEPTRYGDWERKGRVSDF